jgi:hypothetical protein
MRIERAMLHKLMDCLIDTFGFMNTDLMCGPKEYLQTGIS